MMRFYSQSHQFYCGIDLHARLLAICILDQAGNIVLRRQILADKQLLLETLAPYRPDVVVCVECLFAWYWVADLCRAEKIPFVIGHALYMKAIHGGRPRTTTSMPRRSPGCCVAATSRRPTSIPRACARPATCCAAACIWCANAPNSSPISRSSMPSTTCPSSARS